MDAKRIKVFLEGHGLKLRMNHYHPGNTSDSERGAATAAQMGCDRKDRVASSYVTVATIVNQEGRLVTQGIAKCNYKDVPVKKVGIAKALGRAYQNLLVLGYHAPAD